MRREAPEPWASAMIERGLTWGERPSVRALAAAAQEVTGTGTPSQATAQKLVFGESDPEDSTVNAVADALHIERRTVAGWVGQERALEEPWEAPEGTDRLTRTQRDTLDQLIRTMLDPAP